jgi:hypothetical protein
MPDMQSKTPTPKGRLKIQIGDGVPFEQILSPDLPEVIQCSSEGITDLAESTFPPVNHCIYCGATDDLRKEHIIPFGLSGTAFLPKATCPRCARITSAFEAQVLRGPMRAVRVLRRLQSYSKHRGAPTTARLTIVHDGIRETVALPLHEYPILLHFPIFTAPGFLTGQNPSGVSVTGVHTVLYGPSPETALARFGGQEMTLDTQRTRPVAFARMITKIAYGMAFAQGALNQIDEPCPVLPAILNEPDEIARWVGTFTDPIRKYPGLLHRIAIQPDFARRLLIGQVQLFADSETPTYGVILGRLKAGPESSIRTNVKGDVGSETT